MDDTILPLSFDVDDISIVAVVSLESEDSVVVDVVLFDAAVNCRFTVSLIRTFFEFSDDVLDVVDPSVLDSVLSKRIEVD